jgi:hypothetical protein
VRRARASTSVIVRPARARRARAGGFPRAGTRDESRLERPTRATARSTGCTFSRARVSAGKRDSVVRRSRAPCIFRASRRAARARAKPKRRSWASVEGVRRWRAFAGGGRFGARGAARSRAIDSSARRADATNARRATRERRRRATTRDDARRQGARRRAGATRATTTTTTTTA